MGLSLQFDLSVEAGEWPPEPDLARLAERAGAAAAARVPALAGGAEVSLLFTDDAAIRRLNASWRGKDKATNVLSFPVVAAPPAPTGVPVHLGDIVFAHETVVREAAEAGLTLADHMTHLLVHGLLHLVGHDHVDDSEAAAMEGLETAILAGLGIADPYAGTDPEPPETAGDDGR
ncbi:MAG: rRNA maturation RNase YbeY [Bauldia sp.]|nr:rRNA maturation RNase YbeY [Bauldia sp.]